MKRFFKNNKAATAIEFGLIAPIFFALFIAIMEIGMTMFFDSSLNTGIRAAARKGVPEGFGAKSEIEEILNANLGGLYDTGRAEVIILYYNDFDDAQFTTDREAYVDSPSTFFSSKAGAASSLPARDVQSGKIMLYGVRYEWGGVTKFFDPILPSHLYSFAIVRNEEF